MAPSGKRAFNWGNGRFQKAVGCTNEGVQKVGLIMEQRELGARIRGACKKEF